MNTLVEILTFLIRVFGSLYLAMILLRFLLQTARADFYNPASQMLVKITSPLLMPIRRIIPGIRGIDLACIVLALLFHWFVMQLLLLVMGFGFIAPHFMLAWSVISLLLNVLMLYLVAGFIVFISSFIAPFSRHPILLLVRQLLEPVLAPIRRFVPPVGGLDFSLFFAGIFIYVLRILVTGIGQTFNTPFPLLIGYT